MRAGRQGFRKYLGLSFLIGFGFFTMGLLDPLYDTYLPIFLVLPLAAVFRRKPEATSAPIAGTLPPRDWTLHDAIRTRQFWLLGLVYMLTSIGSQRLSIA